MSPAAAVPAGPGVAVGVPQLWGALGQGRGKALVLQSSGQGGMRVRVLTAVRGGPGSPGWSGGAQGERSPAPGASLRVDERPGPLPEAEAFGSEVLGIATCRVREERKGKGGSTTGARARERVLLLKKALLKQVGVCPVCRANREAPGPTASPRTSCGGHRLPSPRSHPSSQHGA